MTIIVVLFNAKPLLTKLEMGLMAERLETCLRYLNSVRIFKLVVPYLIYQVVLCRKRQLEQGTYRQPVPKAIKIYFQRPSVSLSACI